MTSVINDYGMRCLEYPPTWSRVVSHRTTACLGVFVSFCDAGKARNLCATSGTSTEGLQGEGADGYGGLDVGERLPEGAVNKLMSLQDFVSLELLVVGLTRSQTGMSYVMLSRVLEVEGELRDLSHSSPSRYVRSGSQVLIPRG